CQRRSGHRPGGVVRSARARREGGARGGVRDASAPAVDQDPARPRAASGRLPLRHAVPRGESTGMTDLPASPTATRLGLVIDLDTCVGCHACVVNCKEWNTGGYPAPLADEDPYGSQPSGAWLNRVHTYEVGEGADGRTVHFPKSCLHCAE